MAIGASDFFRPPDPPADLGRAAADICATLSVAMDSIAPRPLWRLLAPMLGLDEEQAESAEAILRDYKERWVEILSTPPAPGAPLPIEQFAQALFTADSAARAALTAFLDGTELPGGAQTYAAALEREELMARARLRSLLEPEQPPIFEPHAIPSLLALWLDDDPAGAAHRHLHEIGLI